MRNSFTNYKTTLMNDLLYNGHFKGLDIAFTYAVTTATVNEAVVRHNCDPVAAYFFGRAMTVALLAAAVLPDGQRHYVDWKYSGALMRIFVDAGQDGTVRAFISPKQLSEFGDAHEGLYGEFGDLLVIVLENGLTKSTEVTPIWLHDAVNDLAYHYYVSNGVETGMSAMIGFNPDPEKPVALSQGWMIQSLQGSDLERFDRIRQRMDNAGFRELLGHGSESESYFEQIAKTLIGDEPGFEGIQMESCSAPRFECNCNREIMEDMLRNIPTPERMTMVKRKEPVGINCLFCNKQYEMSIEECIAAWNKKPES